MSSGDQAMEQENLLNSQVEERQETPNCKPNLFVNDVPVTEFLKVIDYLDHPRYHTERRRHSSLPQNLLRTNSRDLDLISSTTEGQRSRRMSAGDVPVNVSVTWPNGRLNQQVGNTPDIQDVESSKVASRPMNDFPPPPGHISPGDVPMNKSVTWSNDRQTQGVGNTRDIQDIESSKLTDIGSGNDFPPPPPELLISNSDIQTPPQPLTIIGMGGPTPREAPISDGTVDPPALGPATPLTPPTSSSESVFIATKQSPQDGPWGKDTPNRHMMY